MTDQQPIVEKLSLFNNRIFTKKQWEIIFQGCGCPKSSHFWRAIRDNNMSKYKNAYTLEDMDTEAYEKILSEYKKYNREGVSKFYKKAKAKQKAAEASKRMYGTAFYMVGGVVTIEKPEND